VITRRSFLRGVGAATGAAVLPVPGFGGSRLALASPAPGRNLDPGGPVLVLVMLRGGMDGLSAVVPTSDAAYYDHRVSSAIPARECADLGGGWGLHPALGPLLDLYRSGSLAFVHAAGPPRRSRSHFQQQDLLERGMLGGSSEASGWVARYLAGRSGAPGAIRAAALVPGMPPSLSGSNALAIEDLDTYAIDMPDEQLGALRSSFSQLGASSPLAPSTAEALDQLTTMASRRPSAIGLTNPFEDHPWSDQFRQIAQLIRGRVGLEVAVVETDGWDLHGEMGDYRSGPMTDQLTHLARGLASFVYELGDDWGRVSVVVVSEFGRRLAENSTGGTDHGYGGLMMVLGSGIQGGRVHGRWAGLSPGALVEGDVPVTTDFRDVLGEVVARRLGSDRLGEVFPGHQPRFPGLT
jgi:uncharacterized protein (DUF1501 family)